MYRVTPYRGFESLPLRQHQEKGPSGPFLMFDQTGFEPSISDNRVRPEAGVAGGQTASAARRPKGESERQANQSLSLRFVDCAPAIRKRGLCYRGTRAQR